jgi:hypothetical protein
MRIYITKSCPMAILIIKELESWSKALDIFDIDQDADAGQRLYNLTGDLAVPTLELEDGTLLVRPSIEQLRGLFVPEEAQKVAHEREQAQLLAQNQHRLAGIGAWVRYLNLVALGCGLFWLGGLNPMGINPAHSFWWVIGASLLMLAVTLADKFGLLKKLGAGLKKPLFYGLFFFMAYLMGLSFVTSQAMLQKQVTQFAPLPVIQVILLLGAALWGASILLQVFKRLWIERLPWMQRLQFVLGLLSLFGFALSLYLVWKNKGLMPVELTWLMLVVLGSSLLVNLAFAVARMRTQSAFEKAAPVLYPAFAILTLLVTLVYSQLPIG